MSVRAEATVAVAVAATAVAAVAMVVAAVTSDVPGPGYDDKREGGDALITSDGLEGRLNGGVALTPPPSPSAPQFGDEPSIRDTARLGWGLG